jgi:hypothetical protein
MLDSSAGYRLASAFSDLAMVGLKAQMSLMAIGPEIALSALRKPEPPPFVPFAPAIWPASRRTALMPPAMEMSLAFWQGWFRYADAIRVAAGQAQPMWPSFASGAAGSGHASQMMGELPRMHVAYQPGMRSTLWPWSSPGMILLAVTLPPALEAMMTGWGRIALNA